METMTDQEWHDFVSAGTRTGKVATVRADGSPHITPVWFVLDGDDLLFNTGKGSVTGRVLARDPRVAIAVDDETPPFARVLLHGEATLSEDLDEVRKWAAPIGGRYMGADRAAEFGERNAVPGELLVRVRVSKVIAHKGIAA
jgi:PPOX class probable F420-dependent enzyme